MGQLSAVRVNLREKHNYVTMKITHLQFRIPELAINFRQLLPKRWTDRTLETAPQIYMPVHKNTMKSSEYSVTPPHKSMKTYDYMEFY